MGKPREQKKPRSPDWLLRRLANECGRHNVSAAEVMWCGLRLAADCAEQLGKGEEFKRLLEGFALEVTGDGEA